MRDLLSSIGTFLLQERKLDGASYLSQTEGLFVIISEGTMPDGNLWTHVSYSRMNRTPSYDDTCKIKKLFIGDDKKAIMVFPEVENHVNIHPYCLHLWSSDKNPLPEFSAIIAGKRSI